MQDLARLHLFLIYAREEIAVARELKFEIAQLGVQVWFDEKPRRDRHVFPAHVRDALIKCDAAIVVWSQVAAESIWVEGECIGARELEKKIIILCQDNTPIPLHLKPNFIISFDSQQQMRTLLNGVLKKTDFAASNTQTDWQPLYSPGNLRELPLTNFTHLDVEHSARQLGFFEKRLNPAANGLRHEYDTLENLRIIHDYATGLAWQVAGSAHTVNLPVARIFIDDLNRERYGGYTGWRLPTSVEVLTLLDSTCFAHGLHLDPGFSSLQKCIWTADNLNETQYWCVDFKQALCFLEPTYNENFVRAVRTLEVL